MGRALRIELFASTFDELEHNLKLFRYRRARIVCVSRFEYGFKIILKRPQGRWLYADDNYENRVSLFASPIHGQTPKRRVVEA